ncbi:MAG: PEP-CTERM sorting domain-containing protein [Rubrivivax sp.]|nr:PEP-CTERM sorting domain-containing protein [Rubrivivax sp.]
MKFRQMCLAATLGLAALGSAHADQTWFWSYTGSGVNASGTFTTAGPALVFEDVLSITGSRNGQPILGLVPLDTDPDFIYDNQFSSVGDHFTDGGLLMAFGGGLPNVNLYFFNGSYTDLFIDGAGDPIETAVNFSVSAVPEPATGLAWLAGLGLMGLWARRRAA